MKNVDVKNITYPFERNFLRELKIQGQLYKVVADTGLVNTAVCVGV